MDEVRGALREAVRAVSAVWGGGPDRDDGDRPPEHRGPLWIGVQVLGIAALLTAVLLVRLLIGPPAPTGPLQPASTLPWFLPAFLLLVPLAVHWFARPPRRVAGLLAALAAGLVVGAAVLPTTAAAPAVWVGLLTLTPAALAAGVVYGVLSPVGPPREA